MKQAIYNGIKDVIVKELDTPKIKDDGILVKNICSSVCGSDVSAYFHGGEFAGIYPGAEFGHEMISEVVKVGKNVKGIEVGQRVYPFPLFAKNDIGRAGTVGGFSEYIEIPNCRENMSVFLVDNKITNIEGCLIEPLTVGCHAAKLTNPQNHQNAIVFGAGMIGMASAIALNYLGIKDIMISDVSPFRLEIAENMGFKVCNAKEKDVFTYAKKIFGEENGKADVDIFIDAAGVVSNIDLFINQAKFGATLSIVAVYHQPISIDLMKLTYGQFNIIGSPAYDLSDVKTVMEMLQSKKYNIESLVTQKYSLDSIQEALEKAADSMTSLKVIIDYR